jgi:ribosome-binding protein aMBF1 (putative translation factor)
MAKPRQPARLRLVRDCGRDAPALGRRYKSGLIFEQATPVTRSQSSTRSAGTLPRSTQPEIVDWLIPSSRPNALCPPAASQTATTPALQASTSSLAMRDNTVKNGISSNVKNGDPRAENARMGRRPTKPASKFWERLEESLGRKPKYQPFNANNLARVLEIKQSVTQQWYAGDSEPELWRIKELAKEGGVCLDWLANNVKPKYPISKDPLLQQLFEVCEQLTDQARETVLSVARGELAKQQQGVEHGKEADQRGGRLRAL